MTPATIPASTYRLQFNTSCTFETARALVDCLHALGVSHCYASNYPSAVPGSPHGYDVADPSRLNPDVGDEDDYARWIEALRRCEMGHIVDVVPKPHGDRAIGESLVAGRSEERSQRSSGARLRHRLGPPQARAEGQGPAPILGDSYGAVLERQEIRLEYSGGAFQARYVEHVLPISPGTYDRVLEIGRDALLDALGPDSPDAVESLSILTAIRHLPERPVSDPALRAERAREKEVVKRRLAVLETRSPLLSAHLARSVEVVNGRRGDPRSFDALDALLTAQSYRVAHWRVAAEEIGAPGVPDFYQGTEIWHFSLVDPDNRQPVDYHRRRRLLQELDAALASEGMGALAERLLAAPCDDRIKFYTTIALLRFRRTYLAIFQRGGYDPVTADGPRGEHVFAFARTRDRQQIIVVVPRLVATLVPDGPAPPFGAHGGADRMHLVLADVFARFPVAVLEDR